jgi:hypothetical protein
MTEITNSGLQRSERNSNKSYDNLILTVTGLLLIAVIAAICALTDSSGVSANDLSTMTVYP